MEPLLLERLGQNRVVGIARGYFWPKFDQHLFKQFLLVGQKGVELSKNKKNTSLVYAGQVPSWYFCLNFGWNRCFLYTLFCIDMH